MNDRNCFRYLLGRITNFCSICSWTNDGRPTSHLPNPVFIDIDLLFLGNVTIYAWVRPVAPIVAPHNNLQQNPAPAVSIDICVIVWRLSPDINIKITSASCSEWYSGNVDLNHHVAIRTKQQNGY